PRTMARADTHKTLTTAVTSTIDLAARFHVMTHLRCPAAPSFHRVDVDHLNAALFHDGPGDRDFVAHLADEKRLRGLVILQSRSHVEVSVRVEDADRIARLRASGGAFLLRRPATAALEVTPHVNDFTLDRCSRAFGLREP